MCTDYYVVDGKAIGEVVKYADGTIAYWLRYLFDESDQIIGYSYWALGDTAWSEYYFAKNLQGDVIGVYRASDNAQVAFYEYDAWGNILYKYGDMADINPFRYRTYYYDNETWFYYLQSRYYDPAIGRFINADVFASTGQGLLGNNMFAYCNNNPVPFEDASGYRLRACTTCIIAGDGGSPITDSSTESTDPFPFTVSIGGQFGVGVGPLSMSVQVVLATDSTGASELQVSYSAPNIFSTTLPSVEEMLADIASDSPNFKFGVSCAGIISFTNAPSVSNLHNDSYSVGASVPCIAVDCNFIPDRDKGVTYNGITIASGMITPGFNVSMSNTHKIVSVPFSVFDVVEAMYNGVYGR